MILGLYRTLSPPHLEITNHGPMVVRTFLKALLISSSLLNIMALATPANHLSVEQTLDSFHTAASKADGTVYFDFFASNGYFIGTDATERWTVDAFRQYAMPYFSKGQGWTYRPVSRHVTYAPDGNVAWFDEILDNDRFGVTRSSGVVVQEKQRWKIAQYHLNVPIPNDLIDKVVDTIRDDGGISTAK